MYKQSACKVYQGYKNQKEQKQSTGFIIKKKTHKEEVEIPDKHSFIDHTVAGQYNQQKKPESRG
jgi:hypothetical protein